MRTGSITKYVIPLFKKKMMSCTLILVGLWSFYIDTYRDYLSSLADGVIFDEFIYPSDI